MGIADHTVYRIYECHNPDCQGQIQTTQKACDPFLVECPFCHKEELLIKNGIASFSGVVDYKKPKTFGSISEQNQRRRDKEGGHPKYRGKKNKLPFWRKESKIDYTVLKNPKKYIETGYK